MINLTGNRLKIYTKLKSKREHKVNQSYKTIDYFIIGRNETCITRLKPKQDTWARNVGKFDGSKQLLLVYVVSTPRIDIDPCSVVADDLSTREHKIT